ncbi:hypothetical protein LCGC14_1400510 [marine sediment metagenome]|uniref:Uncharacterized protein n=1 Tax=marine sediment metagenome TaxID=412755 RepID=A0A0F9MCT3_9ZZZZ
MAELNKPFWVKKRGYYDDASDLDTVPTNCDTANLTISVTANDSTTRGGGSFDSDGLITLHLTDSAAAAADGVGVHVAIYGRAKNTNAGIEPSNIPI